MIAMPVVTDLIEDALSLPQTDRSYLVTKLIESLDAPEPLTEEQAATIRRRSAELRSGEVEGIDLDTLKSEVAARLA